LFAVIHLRGVKMTEILPTKNESCPVVRCGVLKLENGTSVVVADFLWKF